MVSVHFAVILCASFALWSAEGGRILVVVPTPIYSHQTVFRPFTQELVGRGHQVVVLTTDPAFPPGEAPQNLTEIDLHDISYELWRKGFQEVITGKPNDYITQLKTAYDVMIDIFPKQMKTDEVRKLLSDKDQKFDLVVVEAWVYQGLALAHLYNAPAILMSTLGIEEEMYEDIGVPIHPIIYPDITRTRRYNLSLWEQAKMLYNRVELHNIHSSLYKRHNVVIKEMFGDVPPIEELKRNVDLLFVNLHPVWEGYRPMPLGVVHLGGLGSALPKDLPEEIKTIMDSSKRGVIYMSFGSNADPLRLPPERLEMFARVFATLPYDVVMKWQGSPEDFPNNVRTFKWLPQPDLLRHENLSLFITQGGLQSTDEALRAGVPLLGIPLLIDQWINVENYERHGVGLGVDLYTLTENQLREAINILIDDKRYRNRSARMSRVMQDSRLSSLARAVSFAERSIRLRGRRLTIPPGFTWDDVISTLLLAFLIIPVTLIFITILSVKVLRNFIQKTVKECRRYGFRARGYILNSELLPRTTSRC